jgi:ADP-ribose pyrophosphatase YjhB (NUDIX family)
MVPGFRMILEDSKGRVLFIRRADNGKWGLPAGSPELGESMENCISREVKEETSLDVLSFDCFGFASNPNVESHTYPNGDEIQNFTLLIFSKQWTGKAAINDDECTDVQFFNLNDMPPMESLQQHEIASIKLYQKFQNTGKFQWS